MHERLQECNFDEVLKAEAGAKAQKFTDWALKCITLHSRSQRNSDIISPNPAAEIQLRLSAFKAFLELAGSHLTGKDFTEAFDAACFPLTLFSSTFDPGWASGLSAVSIQALLSLLVEGGADNVNQCFLEASRFGSTELVRILLQVSFLSAYKVLLIVHVIRCPVFMEVKSFVEPCNIFSLDLCTVRSSILCYYCLYGSVLNSGITK